MQTPLPRSLQRQTSWRSLFTFLEAWERWRSPAHRQPTTWGWARSMRQRWGASLLTQDSLCGAEIDSKEMGGCRAAELSRGRAKWPLCAEEQGAEGHICLASELVLFAIFAPRGSAGWTLASSPQPWAYNEHFRPLWWGSLPRSLACMPLLHFLPGWSVLGVSPLSHDAQGLPHSAGDAVSSDRRAQPFSRRSIAGVFAGRT